MPEQKPRDKRTRDALNAYVKLMRGMEALTSATHKHLDLYGITTSQFGVMEALFHLGPLCQKDLAQKILKSPGNLTTVIRNLMQQGLVERTRSKSDRRYVRISLTEKGEDLIAAVFPAHAQGMRDALADFTDEELKALITLGRKLARIS